MLDLPGFDTEGRMHLLNAFYLYFDNGWEIDNALEEPKIYRDTLKFRENQFSLLNAVGLVNFHGTCDKSYEIPSRAKLKTMFNNEIECSGRKLTPEQRCAVLRFLS